MSSDLLQHHRSGKIRQEWHCPKSGGGCGCYFFVKLNTEIQGVVTVICPNCKHKHQRNIVDGVIKEQGRWSDKATDEICPTKGTIHWEPQTTHMKQYAGKCQKKEREGAVVS